jgi:hypothetical protein
VQISTIDQNCLAGGKIGRGTRKKRRDTRKVVGRSNPTRCRADECRVVEGRVLVQPRPRHIGIYISRQDCVDLNIIFPQAAEQARPNVIMPALLAP